MNPVKKESLENFLMCMKMEPAASSEEIALLEKSLNLSLPREYRGFLARSNGAAGLIGPEELHLYSTEDAIAVNSRFHEFRKKLFIFGSDGADEAYAFDPSRDWKVLMVPFSAMTRQDAVALASSLVEFLALLASGERLRLIE